MILFIALAALLFGTPTRAAASDCSAAYTASYSWDWNITQDEWEAACRAGAKADEFLRQRQTTAMQACAARFQGKAPDYQATAYCARGRSGEAALAAQLGLPNPEEKTGSKPTPGAVVPVRPGPNFYRIVVSKGSIYPQNLGSPLPDDPSLAGWTYRHFNVSYANFYVPIKGSGGGTCVVQPNFSACARLDPYRGASNHWPETLIDDGCTGLISTQRVIWQDDARPAKLHVPEKAKWTQTKADEMFSVLAYIVDNGCE